MPEKGREESFMKRKAISMLMAVSLAAAALTACGSSSSGSADTTAATTAASTDSTASADAASGSGLSVSVVDGSEDSMNLDTAQAGTLAGLSACRHLYEGLYKLDKDGNVVPGQAKDVQVSDDGLTYTFTLRDDITWSDGQPVTAADFVYGFQHLKDGMGDYSTLLSMVSNAEAKDDKTLVLTLAYPCAYLPSVLAFPSAYPVRQDVVEAAGDAYATDPDKAVYNGPYELTDWTHQQSMTLTKRSDYYDADSISVDQITWDLMSDASTKANSFSSGDVIFADSYPDEYKSQFTDNGLQFEDGYMTYCVMFNLGDNGNEVLKDANVRKALSLAIDRNRVIELRDMDDVIANTYTPSGMKNSAGEDFNTTIDPWFSDDYDANCEEAKKLLADAGYPDGKGFPALTYLVSNNNTQTVAEAIVDDWKSVLGIDSITVQQEENFFSAREDGNYDLSYYGWYMDYPDISNILNTMTTGQNDAKYSSDDYDAAFNAAVAEPDETKQWEDYAKCEEILSNDVPVAPILHAQNSFLFDDKDYDGLVYYCGENFFGYLTKK